MISLLERLRLAKDALLYGADLHRRITKVASVEAWLYGKYMGKTVVKGQLLTDFLPGLLKQWFLGGLQGYLYTDITGIGRNIQVRKSTGATVDDSIARAAPANQGMKVHVGSGTAPPTRGDTKLQAQLGEAFVNDADITFDATTRTLSLFGAIGFATAQTVSEAGVSVSAMGAYFMIDRFLVSPARTGTSFKVSLSLTFP
jgi:hypothetical protein